MTVPRWPTDLPAPNRDGFSRSWGDGRAATRPEYGPPRVRRTHSSAADPVAMSINVEIDGLMRWRRWLNEELVRGSRAFMAPDWAVDGRPMAANGGIGLTTSAGAPISISSWVLCLIDPETKVVEEPRDIYFKVTFGVLVLP